MGKANWYYDSARNRWVIRGKAGVEVVAFNDGGELQLAAGSTRVQRLIGFVGSSAALAAVGLNTEATGTITNATGVQVGDKVFGNPRPVIAAAAKISLNYFNVPTNNVLNFVVSNYGTVAGSLAATGWDVFAIRSAQERYYGEARIKGASS